MGDILMETFQALELGSKKVMFLSEDFFLFLKLFARSSVSTVVAVLDQTSAHVFMGSLETSVSKVKSCVRCRHSERVPLRSTTKICR